MFATCKNIRTLCTMFYVVPQWSISSLTRSNSRQNQLSPEIYFFADINTDGYSVVISEGWCVAPRDRVSASSDSFSSWNYKFRAMRTSLTGIKASTRCIYKRTFHCCIYASCNPVPDLAEINGTPTH